MKKTTITIAIVIVVVLLGLYLIFRSPSKTVNLEDNTPVGTDDTGMTPSTTPTVKTPTPEAPLTGGAAEVIGKSVDGKDIKAYHYGTGTTEILFVGGIHGGYEWNTALVAYKLMSYLQENPTSIPANVRVTVIPVLNPDGLNRVVGTTSGNFTKSDVSTVSTTVVSGRYNSHKVDLNRNFDCDWQTTGKWQNTSVSGGDAVFSEPESIAMKSYIETSQPTSVIVWYSAAGGVYASNCHTGVSTETKNLMNAYSKASGYPANDSFDFYATTGDMTNWLAKIGTPAVSILLTNHTDTEWSKNLAGIQAVFKYYSK
jgi:hypothetical protein